MSPRCPQFTVCGLNHDAAAGSPNVLSFIKTEVHSLRILLFLMLEIMSRGSESSVGLVLMCRRSLVRIMRS